MTENGKTFCDSCNTMENVERYEGISPFGDIHLRLDLCQSCAWSMRGLVGRADKIRLWELKKEDEKE